MNKIIPLVALVAYAVVMLYVLHTPKVYADEVVYDRVVFPEIKVEQTPPDEYHTEPQTSYVIELDDYATDGDTVITLQRVSFYNLVPEQTSPDPSTSSCGVTVERQIGVSRDLFFDENRRKHLCGARVTVITDNGHVFENYVLNDTMNARYELAADVVYPGVTQEDIQAALAMGVSTGTLIIHAD